VTIWKWRCLPDGGQELLHEVGVRLVRHMRACIQHLIVGPLHQPLLQLDHQLDMLTLLHLNTKTVLGHAGESKIAGRLGGGGGAVPDSGLIA
jgi:hypothetical protein